MVIPNQGLNPQEKAVAFSNGAANIMLICKCTKGIPIIVGMNFSWDFGSI